MILYHIEKAKYKGVWPPQGTLHAAGRWNKIGQWVIYCSPSIALAKLEVLANDMYLPLKRVCMSIEISEPFKVHEINTDELPFNWYIFPYPYGLTMHTTEFLSSDKLLMRMPSALSTREHNYLINASHPEFFKKVKLVAVNPEPFDPRLRK